MVERFTAPSAGRGSPVQLLPTGRESGEWVRHSDYAELEAEVERLRKKNEYLEDRNEECEHWRIHWKTKAFEALSRTGAMKVPAEASKEMIEDGVLAYNLTGIAGGVINTAEDHVTFIWNAMAAHLSDLEPAAPEGQQEAVETRIAWEALECIVARADASKLSPIQYEAAEVAAKIARNALEARGEIFPVDFPSGLFPTRPAEQAVTEAEHE